MNRKESGLVFNGTVLIVMFSVWSLLIQIVDVQNIGVNGTSVGFATANSFFHTLTGVNMTLYNITDWLSLVPILICFGFAMLGLFQLIKRRKLIDVDFSLVVLGVYFVIVFICYFIFEIFPLNYRPVLINGFMEASYPSSTTLLVMSVMPTFDYQVKIRIKNYKIKKIIRVVSDLFSIFMVIGRLLSGVHWLTDIVGSVFLSSGLYITYKAIVQTKDI